MTRLACLALAATASVAVAQTEFVEIPSGIDSQPAIGALGFSPKGTYFWCTSRQHLIVWDAKTRTLKWPVKAPRTIEHVAWSADEKTIASVRTEGARATVDLYAVEDGTKTSLRTIDPFSYRIREVAFAPDGNRLLILCHSKKVHVLVVDLKTDRKPNVVEAFPNAGIPPHMAVAPGGQLLAVAHRTNADGLKVFDAETGQVMGSGGADARDIEHLRFLPGGQRLVTTHRNGQIRIWSVEKPKELQVLKTFPSDLEFEDGSHLFATADGGTIGIRVGSQVRLYAATGEPRGVLRTGHVGRWADLSPDGTTIVSAADRAGLLLWRTDELAATGKPPTDVVAMPPYPDERIFVLSDKRVVAFYNGNPWVYEAGKKPEPIDARRQIGETNYLAGFDPIGGVAYYTVYSSKTKHLEAFDLATRKRRSALPAEALDGATEAETTIAPGGGRFFLASSRGKKLWRLMDENSQKVAAGDGATFHVLFSGDGHRFLRWNPSSRRVVLHDAATGEAKGEVPLPSFNSPAPWKTLAFGADERTVYGFDKGFWRLDLRDNTIEHPCTMLDPKASLATVAFAVSPTDGVVAVASDDGLVRLIDPRSGRIRATAAARVRSQSLAFAPDGRTLYAIVEDEGRKPGSFSAHIKPKAEDVKNPRLVKWVVAELLAPPTKIP